MQILIFGIQLSHFLRKTFYCYETLGNAITLTKEQFL